MMKMAAQVTAAGIAGLVALKVVGPLFFPIVGLVFGLFGLLLKIGLIVFVGYFVLEIFNRFRGEHEEEDEEEDEEANVEIEVEEIDEDE